MGTVLRWLLIGIGAYAFVWLWLVCLSRGKCPVCGLELEDDYAFPRQKRRFCRKCGWDGRGLDA